MIQLELSYKTSTIGLNRYLEQTEDWMLKQVFNHERNKTLHSVVKEARKYCRELDVDINGEFDDSLGPTKNAKKLKHQAKLNGTTAIYETWKSKPLHGQYANRSNKADMAQGGDRGVHNGSTGPKSSYQELRSKCYTEWCKCKV